MDQSAKWLQTGLSDSYRGAEISLLVTCTSRPVFWPTKDNSFLRWSEWSRKLSTSLNAVLRLITDGVMSPCPHTPSGLGRLVLRLLSSTSALMWARGPHAVGLGVWRPVSWMYCILQLCKAQRCSMPPVDAVWGVGVAARPPAIDCYNCAGVWGSVPLRSRWRLHLTVRRPRFGSQTRLLSH